MNPPDDPPKTTLVDQRKRPGARVQRVVGAVLAPLPEERRLPARAEPRIGAGPEVVVTGRRMDERVVLPRQRPVGDAQRDDRVRVQRRTAELAVGRAEDDQAEVGQDRARRPDAAAAVVRSTRLGADALTSVWNSQIGLAGVEAGGDDVAAGPLLAVFVDADDDAAVHDHGRREDPGAVVVRVGWAGQARVVVLPVDRTRGRLQCVQGVTPRDDDERRPSSPTPARTRRTR